jgi:hypothetical protein
MDNASVNLLVYLKIAQILLGIAIMFFIKKTSSFILNIR